MSDAKRPDPKRRSPASRPGKAGESARDRPRKTSAARREVRGAEARALPEVVVSEPIKQSIAESAELQSEQRLGSTARRAAILAALVCVLTLTIAGPVRTYFSQRTEMSQLAATEAKLRDQIGELEEQKAKLADPVFIAAQARERLGFVMPGDIPYQVQLPAAAADPTVPGPEATTNRPGEAWYTSLWRTIADAPHNIPPPIPPPAVPPPPPPGPAVPAVPGG